MFPVTVNRFPWYKAGRSVFAVRLMFLVKRVNGFGSHRSIFFVHSNCMHPPRTETSGWMPRPHDTGIFVREKALSRRHFSSHAESNSETIRNTSVFNQNVSPWNQIVKTIPTIPYAKRDPSDCFSPNSILLHPFESREAIQETQRGREREREEVAIPCIYARNIVRVSLYWMRVDIEEGRS